MGFCLGRRKSAVRSFIEKFTMITKDTELPSIEELTVPEINISHVFLRAAAFHMGKECEKQNNEFMLCTNEEDDPRKCLKEGREVTSCAMGFLRKIKKSCLEEFNQYANCLDKSSADWNFKHCRNTQSIFDKCVLDNLGIERPEYGYFCRPKVHDSDRPQPPPESEIVFPDAAQPIPESSGDQRAFYGTRVF